MKFSTKVCQKALTPPQKEYLHKKIDELLAAGIIERCSPSKVKCVSPIALAKKVHKGQGLMIDKLKHKLNNKCIAAGLPASFNLPPCPEPRTELSSPPDSLKPQKWQICQNFTELNKVTEIAPMPQGNIHDKQRALSSHNWICLFDFASRFYACEVTKESQPYTAFYVEGKGYLNISGVCTCHLG